MLHLKRFLFGIILLSSFGSAFADEYDPKQDVFDQIINTLVPLAIVFLFKESEKEDLNDSPKVYEEQVNTNLQMRYEIVTMKAQIREMQSILAFMKGDSHVEKHDDVEKQDDDVKKQDDDVEKQDDDVEKQEEITLRKSIFYKVRRVFDKIRQGSSPVKIKRAFDDLLFLLSLFVLPCIVLYKHHKEFAIPIWIPILFGVTAGFVFIIFICNYIFSHKNSVIILTAIVIDLSHIISDICFIFYTKNIPASSFTGVFIYLHAVTGILGSFLLFFYLCWLILVYSRPSVVSRFYYYHLKEYIVIVDPFLRKSTIIITFIWTPVIQMLNMSLFSGNDYYWTKSILALNLIYLSRVLNYAGEKIVVNKAQFGVIHNIFHYIRKINDEDGPYF